VKAAMRGVLLAALLFGCGSPPPPPPKAPVAAAPVAPKPVAAKPATPEPGAADAAKDTFMYSPIGKRDPFRSPLDDLIIKTNDTVHTCPLCRWEVDQLKLVAVITGTGSPVAMVEDPNGLGHFLRQGTIVGKAGGKVTSIQRDEVVVTEISHDPFGKIVQNRSQMKIEQPAEDPNNAAPSLLNE
jgi:type IV pilus assembly protein PilP